jgi:hypothetical protein
MLHNPVNVLGTTVWLFAVAEEVIMKNAVLQRCIDFERNLLLPPLKHTSVQLEDAQSSFFLNVG